MKKSFKRSIAVILSVLMIVASLPFTALAATGEYKPDVQMQFGTVSDPDVSGDYFNTTFDSSDLQYSALYGPALDYSDGTLTLHADKTNGVADSGAAAASEDHTLVVGDYFTATVRLDNISKLAAFSMAIKYSENIEPAGIYSNSGSTELVGLSDVTADMTAYAAAAKPYSYASASKVYSGINGGNVGDLSYINTTDHYIMAEAAATDGSTGVDVSSGSSNGEKLVNPETGVVGYDYVKQVPVATFIFKVVEEGPIEFSIYDSDNSKLPAYTGGFYIADETDGTTVADYTTYATSAESNGSTLLTFNKKNSNNASSTTYKIVFKGADGSVISSKEYEDGATVTIPALPTKDADVDYHYSYAWDTTPSAKATADATYTAVETKAAHTWDEGVVTKPATSTTEGEKTYTCTVCKHTKTEVIPKTECEHKNTTTTEKVTKEATCKEAGSKTVTVTCNDCGKVISTTTVEIPKLAHKYGEWKYNGDAVYNKSTDYQDGTMTRKCSVCGETETKTATGTANLRPSSYSLVLDASLTMNFKVKKTAVASFKDVKVKIVRGSSSEEYTEPTSTDSSNNIYAFSGISPQAMKDDIDAVVYATVDGVEVWGPTYSRTIFTYCKQMVNNSKYLNATTAKDKAFRTLLVDLLNYGAAAQIKSNYKTDNLANAELTDVQKAWASPDIKSFTTVKNYHAVKIDNPTARWNSGALRLGDAVTPRMTFSLKTASLNINDISIKVTINGSTYEYNIKDNPECFQYVSTGTTSTYGEEAKYQFYFTELRANNMSTTFSTTIMKNGVAVSDTATYSAESYVQQAYPSAGSADKALYMAMLKYGNAAAAYGKA